MNSTPGLPRVAEVVRGGQTRAPQGTPPVVGALACFLAAAIPNDALVGLAESGARTPSLLVGVAFTCASVLIAPRIVRSLSRAPIWFLFLAAFTLSVLVMLLDVAEGRALIRNAGNIDKPYKLLLMALLLAAVYEDERWRSWTVPAYLAGWWIFIGVSLAQLATGSHIVSEHKSVERISILGMNENGQAIIAASGIVLLAAAAIHRGKARDLVLFAAGIAGGGLVFAVGNSRTAVVALAAGLAVVVIAELRVTQSGPSSAAKRILRLGLVSLVGGSVLAAAVQWVPLLQRATEAMERRVTAAIDGVDLGQRDRLAASTLEIIADNPLGVGFDQTVEILGENPHNDILKIIAEGGFLAGFVLVLAIAMLAKRCWALAAVPGESAALGGLVLFGTTALTGQGFMRATFWLFFALVTATRVTRKSHAAETPSARRVYGASTTNPARRSTRLGVPIGWRKRRGNPGFEQ